MSSDFHRAVTLSPFLISKYEITQSQWERMTGENPSYYGPDAEHYPGPGAPVANVSWLDCRKGLSRWGLSIPTEAQWEYSARGGTDSPWWTGREIKSLQGAANLADRFCKEHGGSPSWAYDLELDDGFVSASSAGSHVANPFGLHDMIGNVSEWCRDAYVTHDITPRPGDGMRAADGEFRAIRGGSWDFIAVEARVTNRKRLPADYTLSTLGIRPVLAVEGE